MPNAGTKGGVFISYSHKDTDWLEKLQTMMSPLIRNRTLSVWWDAKIKPSQKWREEIDNALASAKVGVLLVSPNFLASDFISNNELPYLLDAAKRHAVELIWVLVRNCLYDKTPIGDYQAAYDISKPLNSLGGARLDDALVAICNAIAEAATESRPPGDPGALPSRACTTSGGIVQEPRHSAALKIWEEKLAYLQVEEAKAVHPDQKFSIRKSIEEARERIREYTRGL